MSHPNILDEIGRTYEGDLMCIGVMERPAIVLKDNKTGEKTMLAIGSHAYIELEPKREAAPLEPKKIDASNVGLLPLTCLWLVAGTLVYMVIVMAFGRHPQPYCRRLPPR